MTDLPDIAISIRQPWAWAILCAVKTDDGRACPIITGEAHNVTLGSLL